MKVVIEKRIRVRGFSSIFVYDKVTWQLYYLHKSLWLTQIITHAHCCNPHIWKEEDNLVDTVVQEKYWEEHPGEAVPLMKPKFYSGPWRVIRGEVPIWPNQGKP